MNISLHTFVFIEGFHERCNSDHGFPNPITSSVVNLCFTSGDVFQERNPLSWRAIALLKKPKSYTLIRHLKPCLALDKT
jgi:hypothetical protein